MFEICEEKDCPQASQAANKAVARVFAIMGVDVEDPAALERFRRDFRFAGDLRRSVDSGLSTMGKTALAIVVGGLVMGTWAMLKTKLGITK